LSDDTTLITRRPSLREDVCGALRAALVAGQLRPGEVYSAPRLARQFGVSATPVREALLQLVTEGLLRPVPNKGFRVVEISEPDLDEIAALRHLLEAPAVAELARRRDQAGLNGLREQAGQICAAADEGDVIRYLEADLAFHLGMLAALGNRRLVAMVRELRAQTRLYGLSRLAHSGQLAASAREHLDLLDLVRAGDAPEAEALMRRHIGHTRGIWASSTIIR
jgi:DNA-binding GntR family transcriptional regulator